MTFYQKRFMKLLNIDSRRARLVEAYLRLQYGTLDSLDGERIKLEYGELGISDAIDSDLNGAENLALSYGL